MFTQCIHVHRVGPRRRGECIENRCSHSAFMYIELGLEGGEGCIENRRTRRNKMFEISNAIKNER